MVWLLCALSVSIIFIFVFAVMLFIYLHLFFSLPLSYLSSSRPLANFIAGSLMDLCRRLHCSLILLFFLLCPFFQKSTFPHEKLAALSIWIDKAVILNERKWCQGHVSIFAAKVKNSNKNLIMQILEQH